PRRGRGRSVGHVRLSTGRAEERAADQQLDVPARGPQELHRGHGRGQDADLPRPGELPRRRGREDARQRARPDPARDAAAHDRLLGGRLQVGAGDHGQAAPVTESAALLRRPSTTRRRRRAIEGYAFVSPWIAGFVLFTLGPMVVSLYLSLNDYAIIKPP